jgi:hypothetical protein
MKKNIIIDGKTFNNIEIEEKRYFNLKTKDIGLGITLDYVIITDSNIREYFEKLLFKEIFGNIELTLSEMTYTNCAYLLKSSGKVFIYIIDDETP